MGLVMILLLRWTAGGWGWHPEEPPRAGKSGRVETAAKWTEVGWGQEACKLVMGRNSVLFETARQRARLGMQQAGQVGSPNGSCHESAPDVDSMGLGMGSEEAARGW